MRSSQSWKVINILRHLLGGNLRLWTFKLFIPWLRKLIVKESIVFLCHNITISNRICCKRRRCNYWIVTYYQWIIKACWCSCDASTNVTRMSCTDLGILNLRLANSILHINNSFIYLILLKFLNVMLMIIYFCTFTTRWRRD